MLCFKHKIGGQRSGFFVCVSDIGHSSHDIYVACYDNRVKWSNGQMSASSFRMLLSTVTYRDKGRLFLSKFSDLRTFARWRCKECHWTREKFAEDVQNGVYRVIMSRDDTSRHRFRLIHGIGWTKMSQNTLFFVAIYLIERDYQWNFKMRFKIPTGIRSIISSHNSRDFLISISMIQLCFSSPRYRFTIINNRKLHCAWHILGIQI